MKYADLHTHTYFSDGTYSPAEVVRESIKENLNCISITDHDEIEGIYPAIVEARSKDIEIIPGIEMSTEVDGREAHILGYFIDYQNNNLLDKLIQLKQIRIDRIYQMVDKLHDLGLKDISAEEVIKNSEHGVVGRMHLAAILKNKGLVGSINEAFYRYISDNGPAYVGKFRFSPKEVIDSIHDAGGVSVIAHPHSLAGEQIIADFVSYGVKAIEVYYPEYNQQQTNYFISLAKKFGLLLTGGSDSHGEAKENTPIGKVRIPYELVEELKKLKHVF